MPVFEFNIIHTCKCRVSIECETEEQAREYLTQDSVMPDDYADIIGVSESEITILE